MKIFGNNVKQALWINHLYRYGSSLMPYFSEWLHKISFSSPILTSTSIYFCPLCVESYFIYFGGVLSGNCEFSNDHVPPASMGGNLLILTCKSCNNKAGKFEAELLKVIQFGNVPDKKTGSLWPHTYVKEKGTSDLFKVSMTKTVDRDKNHYRFSLNEHEKKHISKVKTFSGKIQRGEIKEFTVQVRLPHYRSAYQAILKSAYLLCFIGGDTTLFFLKEESVFVILYMAKNITQELIRFTCIMELTKLLVLVWL